jgi:hypothetical protein
MATQKQRQTAKKNVKKAQEGARQKKTVTKLSSKTRSALGARAPRPPHASAVPRRAPGAALGR